MLKRTIACYVISGAVAATGAVIGSPGSPTVVATIMARAGFADIKLKVGDKPELAHRCGTGHGHAADRVPARQRDGLAQPSRTRNRADHPRRALVV